MSKGYTILELLVVVAIISVLSIITVSNFPQAKLQFSLSRVANQFEQDVRRAQQLSLSSAEFIDSNNVAHPVKGYGIYINTLNNTEYIIYADNFDDLQNNQRYDAGRDYIVETIDFTETEPGIVIKHATSAGAHFNPPNPITTFQPSLESVRFDIVFAYENDVVKNKTVSIYATGLVEIQ
ncbi:MAG: type II secretion system protein [Candidatus Staskawiczbacteria bacterium]|nr:type II secretion system protein [Candidatus Staskawiczbacteria bacterium]